MYNKILIMVYVPLIESEFDIYVPTVKKVGTIKKLIMQIIEERSDKNFEDDGTRKLYYKLTGEEVDDKLFVRDSNLENGSRIILY